MKLKKKEKLEITPNKQEIYDVFNKFIFSNDIKILSKLLFRAKLFNKVKNVPGDIVECGLFRGSGILSFLKIKQIFSPNAFKKIIGFDFFNTKKLIESLHGKDKETMLELFSGRNFELNNNYIFTLENIIKKAGFTKNSFELIKGDIKDTSLEYVKNRPGAKISLLYLDMDLEEPTYQSLKNFWPIISVGGLVIFDEYACHTWSESKGADRFAKEHNLTIKTFDCNAPTAYIIK